MRKLESQLPDLFKQASIVRQYNIVTGASLSHYDLAQMSIFERDEVLLLIRHSELIQ